MKKLICVLFAIVFVGLVLQFSPIRVHAEEVDIDWDAIDWDNFWMGNVEEVFPYDEQTIVQDWRDWMEHEATLEKLIEVHKARPDGFYATDYAWRLGVRFMAEPQAFMRVLAQCDAGVQDTIVLFLVGSDKIAYETQDAVLQYFQSIQLPQDATDAERAVLQKLIRRAENRYEPWIPNTGDPILAVFALMAFSGSAALWLTLRRKRV